MDSLCNTFFLLKALQFTFLFGASCCSFHSVLAGCSRYSTQSGAVLDMAPAKRKELEDLINRMVSIFQYVLDRNIELP